MQSLTRMVRCQQQSAPWFSYLPIPSKYFDSSFSKSYIELAVFPRKQLQWLSSSSAVFAKLRKPRSELDTWSQSEMGKSFLLTVVFLHTVGLCRLQSFGLVFFTYGWNLAWSFCLPSTPKVLQYKKILRGINFVKNTKHIFQRWSRIWPLLFGFCAISTWLPEERMGVTKKSVPQRIPVKIKKKHKKTRGN